MGAVLSMGFVNFCAVVVFYLAVFWQIGYMLRAAGEWLCWWMGWMRGPRYGIASEQKQLNSMMRYEVEWAIQHGCRACGGRVLYVEGTAIAWCLRCQHAVEARLS
jgi:hypothetical protein